MIARAVSACSLCAVMALPYGAATICFWAQPQMVAMAATGTHAPVLASQGHGAGGCDVARCAAVAVAPAVTFEKPAFHVGTRFAYRDLSCLIPRLGPAPLTPPPLA